MRIAGGATLLAFVAMAQSHIVGRDPTTISGLLSSIFDSMANTDNHILQYQSGGDPAPLRQAARNLIVVIVGATDAAKHMAPLTLHDLVTLHPISQQLTEMGAKFIQDLGDTVPKFAATGHCAHVHMFAVHFGAITHEFFMTTKKLIPWEGQGFAQQQIEEIGVRFAQVQAALLPPFCIDSVESPPFEHPPFEHPPFEHPPFEHPPSEHPPFEHPPSEHPPFEQPPSEQPPFEHPPSQPPPMEHPPFQAPPCESDAPAVPSITTSVVWQTSTWVPSQPTSAPDCGQPCGHGNGTHPSRPSPTPVTGAGSTLAVSGAAMALMMGVAFLL